MNCRECLDELATGSLRDLTPDAPVARHAARCPDCGPLLTQLRDREYLAATTLNNLQPISDPIAVAETAGRLSRRRRTGRVVTTIAAIALAISIWFAADSMLSVFNHGAFVPGGLQTETIPLTCLSPAQAGDVINPYLRGPGRIYYTAPGVRAITVRATPSEVWHIRDVLKDFDNPRSTMCGIGVKAAFDAAQKALNDLRLDQLERPERAERRERREPTDRAEPLESPEPVVAGKATISSKRRLP